jgi:hypothetical protein
MTNTILESVNQWFTPNGFIQPDTPALRKKYAKLRLAIKAELASVIEPQEDEIYSVTVTNAEDKHFAYAYCQDSIWYGQSTNLEIEGIVTINTHQTEPQL